MRRIRNLLIWSIHTGGTCINQMLHSCLPIIIRMTACFQNIVKSNQVALNIWVLIGNGITYSRLCCKINNQIRLVCVKKPVNTLFISYVTFNQIPPGSIWANRLSYSFYFRQSPFLNILNFLIFTSATYFLFDKLSYTHIFLLHQNILNSMPTSLILLASGEINHSESGRNSQFEPEGKNQYTSFSFL